MSGEMKFFILNVKAVQISVQPINHLTVSQLLKKTPFERIHTPPKELALQKFKYFVLSFIHSSYYIEKL